MAVRAFNGGSDLINTATGALSTNTFGTFAVIVKRGTTNAWHTFLAFHNSGGDALTQYGYNNGNLTAMWKSVGPDSSTGPAAIPTTAWGLLIYRKATGTATGRFSLYNFSTTMWTHGAANISMGNWTAPGASGTIRVEWQGGDRLNGRLAARAAWNSLPWAASAAGDTAIEAAGLEASAANWMAASPDAMWLFNQAAVTDVVTDMTGGGADQTSRTGTTVITTDDPPGFDFSPGGGGGEVVGAAALTLGGISFTATGHRIVHGSATASLGGTTITSTGRRVVHGSANLAFGGITIAAAGRRLVHATATLAMAGLDLAAAGSRVVHGAATVAVGGVSLTAVGTVAGSTVGTASLPLAGVTLTVTGRRVVHGSAGVTLGGLFLTAVGEVEGVATGAVQVILGGVTLTATGRRIVHGTATFALGGIALTAVMDLGDPNPVFIIYDEAPRQRTYTEPTRAHIYQEV